MNVLVAYCLGLKLKSWSWSLESWSWLSESWLHHWLHYHNLTGLIWTLTHENPTDAVPFTKDHQTTYIPCITACISRYNRITHQ